MKMPAGIPFNSHYVCAQPYQWKVRTLQQGGAKGIGPVLIELAVPGVRRVSAIDSALPEHVSFSIFTYYETFRHSDNYNG